MQHLTLNGIVVSGGLVMAAVLGSAARDISDVVLEKLLFGNNLRPVSPADTLSAISYIVCRKDVPGYDHMEHLLVKTIGIKNLNPSTGLCDVPLSRDLFQSVVPGTSTYYKEIGLKHNSLLHHSHIVCEILRWVYRPKSNN